MKVWGIKARWIKACIVSNKRFGLRTTCMYVDAYIYPHNPPSKNPRL